MAKLLNLKEKPAKIHPLVEILGPIDIGKTPIAQLVARRVKGHFISFPVLDPTTITGRGLLASLTTMPRGLEANPHWWAHIYAANLYEQSSRITQLLEKQPVIVTNYTLAYKTWMRILGLNISNFTTSLPEPNIAYLLYGDPIVPSSRPIFDFSPEFSYRVKRNVGLGYSIDSMVRKVILSDFESKFPHVCVNNVATAITANLRTKFKCRVDETELYTADSFLKKKDV